MRAETGQTSPSARSLLPRIELAADETDRFPQRPPRVRDTSTFELDDRSRDLNDSGVEVHGSAGRKLIGGAGPVQEISSDEGARISENRLRPGGDIVDIERELRLEPDSRESEPRNRVPGFFHSGSSLG